MNHYPRPQLRRESWINLCGAWDYAITDSPELPALWQGKIEVPFSPETPASGVNRALQPGQYLWYRRQERFPKERGRRLLLHIGAADQQAAVFCNGREVTRHIGGYAAFSADLTDFLGPDGEGEIVIAVRDDTDLSPLARGKQRRKRGGIWYTPQSGLWQPVWAESVPDRHIRQLRITPLFDEACVFIDAEAGAVVHFEGEDYPCPAKIPVPGFIPWSPEDPHLYPLTVTLGEDRAESYFAMRKFSVEKGRICLNGQPYFMNGVLDQGYNPEGFLSYPSDEAMIKDIELAKSLGFNTLRKHAKTEPMRWYYHCDRLGMIVWQDIPNGGGNYSLPVCNAPLFLGSFLSDRWYRLFGRQDAWGRKMYYQELRELMEQLYNCPCIALWVLFNEGWGQFDSEDVLAFAQKLDPTRILDPASGWHDQGIGKLKDYHIYFRKYKHRPDKKGRAVVVSEYGGYNLRLPGHAWNAKNFGYNHCKDAGDLAGKLRTLFQGEIAAAKAAGLSAAIYTQLSDVEDELNGLVTYDRQALKLPAETLRRIVEI